MVTTIDEVNIVEAYIFQTDNRYIRQKNSTQLTGFSNWQDAIEILDSNHEVVTPQPSHTNQDFIEWENARLSELSNEDAYAVARETIRTLSTNAVNFTEEISICFAAIKNAQFNGDNDTNTFDAMIAALNDASIGNGFRNAVRNVFQAQTGILLDFADVSGVVIAEKRQFNAFCDYFFTSWALMAFIGKRVF